MLCKKERKENRYSYVVRHQKQVVVEYKARGAPGESMAPAGRARRCALRRWCIHSPRAACVRRAATTASQPNDRSIGAARAQTPSRTHARTRTRTRAPRPGSGRRGAAAQSARYSSQRCRRRSRCTSLSCAPRPYGSALWLWLAGVPRGNAAATRRPTGRPLSLARPTVPLYTASAQPSPFFFTASTLSSHQSQWHAYTFFFFYETICFMLQCKCFNVF